MLQVEKNLWNYQEYDSTIPRFKIMFDFELFVTPILLRKFHHSHTNFYSFQYFKELCHKSCFITMKHFEQGNIKSNLIYCLCNTMKFRKQFEPIVCYQSNVPINKIQSYNFAMFTIETFPQDVENCLKEVFYHCSFLY